MWKIRKLEDDGRKVLSISGRIEADELGELQKVLSSEGTGHKKVELDLKDVKLVDRHVISFLAGCEANGTRLRNCPLYIREWIAREIPLEGSQD
jgi:ABC-type transporter Mla MlaB component